jgi:hypothetical protein
MRNRRLVPYRERVIGTAEGRLKLAFEQFHRELCRSHGSKGAVCAGTGSAFHQIRAASQAAIGSVGFIGP